jgi:hypothetical protein
LKTLLLLLILINACISDALREATRRIHDVLSNARFQIFNTWIGRDQRKIDDFQLNARFQEKLQMLVDKVESLTSKLENNASISISAETRDAIPIFLIGNSFASSSSSKANEETSKSSKGDVLSELEPECNNIVLQQTSHWISNLCLSIKSKIEVKIPDQIESKFSDSTIEILLLKESDLNTAASALCRTKVIVPVLSLIEQRNASGTGSTYSGSLGQLVGLDPRQNDRIDPFLVQIVIINALLASPLQQKNLKSVYPIFSKLETSGDGSQSLSHANILQLLSTDPSIESNDKAAELLLKNGMPVASGMLHRSIRENIARLFDLLAYPGSLKRQVLFMTSEMTLFS